MKVDQTTFRSALLDPEIPSPEGLCDNAGRPAGRRFDVYRNNVAASLGEALEMAFPVVAKLVGTQNFRTLAGVFHRRFPPTSPLMMYYGTEMPSFLSDFGPTSKIGYLPDVARLEIALRESYHAADAEPIDPEKLQSLPPDRLIAAKVTLAPSFRLINSRWPVYSIWRFNTSPGAPKPTMQAEDVAILRPDLDPEPYLLPAGGGVFLASLQQGNTLGDALDAANEATAEFDLPAVLSILIGAGAITAVGDPI